MINAVETLTKTEEKTKIEFKGETLIQFGSLKYDPFGREILRQINEVYRETPAEFDLSIQKENEPVKGSSPFKLFAADYFTRKLDSTRVMLPEESELFLMLNKMPEVNSTYKDLGLVMDFSGNNHDLAVHFYEQLNKEQQYLDRFPAVFTGLKPTKSDIGSYGLVYELAEYSQLRTAKILNEKTGSFESDDPHLLIDGLPSNLGKGNRKLYTINQLKPSVNNLGLCSLCLDTDLDLYSDCYFLADSLAVGRVVVVSGGATSQKILDNYMKQLQETANRDIEIIKARAEKAKGYLTTGKLE